MVKNRVSRHDVDMSTFPSPVAKETLMGSFIWRDKGAVLSTVVNTKGNGGRRKLAFKIASEAVREWHLKVFIRSLGSYHSHPLFELASQPTIPSIGHCVWYPSFLYIDKNKCFTSRLDHVLSLHLSPSLSWITHLAASRCWLFWDLQCDLRYPFSYEHESERQETLCNQEAEWEGEDVLRRSREGLSVFYTAWA